MFVFTDLENYGFQIYIIIYRSSAVPGWGPIAKIYICSLLQVIFLGGALPLFRCLPGLYFIYPCSHMVFSLSFDAGLIQRLVESDYCSKKRFGVLDPPSQTANIFHLFCWQGSYKLVDGQ